MVPKRQMIDAEAIMAEDADILRALASTQLDKQLTIARTVMKQRKSALKKLAK